MPVCSDGRIAHDSTYERKQKYVAAHLTVDFSRDQIKVNDVYCPHLADVHCSEECYHDKKYIV